MCIWRETREKVRQSLAFSRVSKPHTHITHMLRQCTSIVYILSCFFTNHTDKPQNMNNVRNGTACINMNYCFSEIFVVKQ